MEKSEALKMAQAAFKLSKDAKEMHVTSDGNCFLTKNDANNHAFTMSDKAVHSFIKEEMKADSSKAEVEAKSSNKK